ncbi:phosphopantothenoylcysteine decarboxylase isoform X2 [Plodia interpunctella]|uniref:phosphopantothenoylcysteine decarboxylase isoform X2 n=1 Tax=Plodia interpunctella TaxID=58824 RepID=UPI00236857CC|nr:phosphopantothenoylcysteine decarboxylase isoform X2 [Plodia interpunctella]
MMVATKILIGATGSVASLKIPILAKSLLDLNEQGFDFELTELPSVVPIYDDALEWNAWKDRGDPVLHVDLGKWADLMVIAPLDANTLAKMAQGICDNLLTCTTRAWDLSKPLIFCPSMNTRMWQHPITAAQIATLKEWGHEEIPPIEKLLICGDKGMGAMAEVATIVNRVKNIASLKS